MGLRIEVDRDACCGSGNCVLTAPAVFDQADADGLVVLLDPTPPDDQRAAVRTAAHICPSGAIGLVSD